MQYHAIPCKTMQYHAKPCHTMQYHAIPCNTMQYNAIPCNTMQYHTIPCNTMQYHAIPCNTMQYNAMPCYTLQCHASLITADGAYHCPVGSIMAIFIICLLVISIFICCRCSGPCQRRKDSEMPPGHRSELNQHSKDMLGVCLLCKTFTFLF